MKRMCGKSQRRSARVRMALALLLLPGMLLSAGCGNEPAVQAESRQPTVGNTAPGETVAETEASHMQADASLTSLRQAMVETPQLFAVAYFGYHETVDSNVPVDPIEVMREYACSLCEDLPFLQEIPQDRIVGETGDLFCIVPLDEDATVAVSKGIWNESSEEYLYEESIYFSKSGEPILLFCNNAGFDPDTQLSISGPSGEVIWCPQADDNLCAMPLGNGDGENLFFDFSSYREILMKYHQDMKDSEWVMPTADMLKDSTWVWEGFLKDGREVSYQLIFQERTLSVIWNNGIDEADHEYLYAPWELTYDEGFAILSIDFGEMAGVLRYNLLYHEGYGQLYVAMDSVHEEMPIGGEPLYRFLTPPMVPEPVEMLGQWELVWTEVEGDRNEAAPGSRSLEITSDHEGLYRISCVDNEFADRSFYDKELVVFPFELYPGCGNDQWIAAVNHTGKDGTGYDLTLLPDGTLLMQNCWEMDGAPMVSYSLYRRGNG